MIRYLKLCLGLVIGVAFATTVLAQSADWFTYNNPALTNSVQTVKGSPGPLIAYQCYNPNAAMAYIQIFDAISGVSLGTTVPKLVLPIAGLSTTGLQNPSPPFSGAVGLQVAATTTQRGSTAPSVGLACEFYYR